MNKILKYLSDIPKHLNNLFNYLFGRTASERYYSLTNLFFILTILIASFASLFHVKGFWLITNSTFWATLLAFATGAGVIGSMMASKYTWWTYVSFTLIILMELFGNIYDAFKYIDVNSANFIAWKELIEPIFNLLYTLPPGQSISDIVYMRWIACIQGSFIPILVAIVFHMWIEIRKAFKNKKTQKDIIENIIEDKTRWNVVKQNKYEANPTSTTHNRVNLNTNPPKNINPFEEQKKSGEQLNNINNKQDAGDKNDEQSDDNTNPLDDPNQSNDIIESDDDNGSEKKK